MESFDSSLAKTALGFVLGILAVVPTQMIQRFLEKRTLALSLRTELSILAGKLGEFCRKINIIENSSEEHRRGPPKMPKLYISSADFGVGAANNGKIGLYDRITAQQIVYCYSDTRNLIDWLNTQLPLESYTDKLTPGRDRSYWDTLRSYRQYAESLQEDMRVVTRSLLRFDSVLPIFVDIDRKRHPYIRFSKARTFAPQRPRKVQEFLFRAGPPH